MVMSRWAARVSLMIVFLTPSIKLGVASWYTSLPSVSHSHVVWNWQCRRLSPGLETLTIDSSYHHHHHYPPILFQRNANGMQSWYWFAGIWCSNYGRPLLSPFFVCSHTEFISGTKYPQLIGVTPTTLVKSIRSTWSYKLNTISLHIYTNFNILELCTI